MGYAVAKVAVSTAVYSVDKPYSYILPKSMCQNAAPGMRVVVPFGRGNTKSEGIILSIEQNAQKDKLKPVISLLDESPVICDEMMRLALWIRDRFFCTFYDALHSMIPSGMWNETEKLYYIPEDIKNEDVVKAAGRSDVRAKIIEYLKKQKKPVPFGQIISDIAADNTAKEIKTLVNKGILIQKDVIYRKITDKKVKMAALSYDIDRAREEISKHKRLSKISSDIVEYLGSHGDTTQNELCYMTGCSPAQITTLIKKGILKTYNEEIYRRPVEIPKYAKDTSPTLNEEQKAAFLGLSSMLDKGEAAVALLLGVTGSGKTEVYIKLIEKAVESGKSALMLVPEISLTPQLMRKFGSKFGDKVALMHSALSEGERYDEWKRIKNGEATVVVGTRSAVFAPLSNIGIIIIDEEQENTYKSENAPRYHARDAAKFRCVQNNALLLLGSATPSVESYHAAMSGRYKLFEIQERYLKTELPDVIIDDMKEAIKDGLDGNIGPTLYQELKANIEKKEQSILFINRRGDSRVVKCRACGYTPMCEKCSVALTYHSANDRLMCHYCGYSIKMPEKCPECGSDDIRFSGSGTQKIEKELKELFKDAKIIRMDADTTSAKQSHEKLLSEFELDNYDILLGTQMVAKGLDFDNVTLVGIIDADLSLFCDDYRAAEKTFSLIAQVIGRAGRRDKRGRAVIQTYVPENRVINLAAQQDYKAFFKDEIAVRQAFLYPPAKDMVVFTLIGSEEHEVLRAAMRLSGRMAVLFKSQFSDIASQILGPVPAQIAKINRKYRYHISFRADDTKRRRMFISGLLLEFSKNRQNKGISIFADINPLNM